MPAARIAALLVALPLLAGCQTFLPPPSEQQPPPFEFRLGAGDRIQVSVWGEKELKRKLQLGPDGVVSFPIIGDINLGGMNLNEARVELAKRLKAGYVDPVVSITLLEMRSHILHVLGEVKSPGTVSFVRGATVLAAVQAAGGVRTGTADLTAVRVVRHRTTRPKVYQIDLEAVLAGEIRDMWLVPGDSVLVPPRLLTRWNRWWRQAFPWSDGVDGIDAPKK